jgi:large subunit ribosomal protein L33
MRVFVDLECTECDRENYRTQRSKDDGKLTLQKYCPKCRKHTEHKES